MPLLTVINNILLSAALAMQPLPSLEDTVKVDLTGDKEEEAIVYRRSYADSSFCKVLMYNPKDSSHVEAWKRTFMLEEGQDYRLVVGDFNGDGVKDFTIEKPDAHLVYYVTWDKKDKRFVIVESDSLGLQPAAPDSSAPEY